MACFHCLQPIPKGVELVISYKGAEKPVCCAGCQAVAETIIEHKLHSYYEHRDTSQIQEIPILPDALSDLELYDHPDLQKEFIRHQDDETESTTLTVENITCGACGWLIERELMRLDGIKKAVVNVSSRRLLVSWRSDTVKLSDILRTLAGIGYKALPFQPNEAEQQYTRQRKGYIRRLGVAGLATMQVMMIAFALYFGVVSDLSAQTQHFLWLVSLIFATPVIFYSAQPFYIGALRGLQASRLSMDMPVSIALLGAYSASVYATLTQTGEVYFESISMFTFFLLTGRFLELLAKERALKFATNRLTLLPKLAVRETSSGTESVAIKQLVVGDIIRVKAGETIPADGDLLDTQTQVDESLLTGESLPRLKTQGDALIAGSINQHSPIRIQVTATAQQTVLAGIIAMQDSALAVKPKAQQTIDRLSGYFIGALLTIAFITYLSWWWVQPDHALWVTLAVLVATCPCALSLAAPTALTGIIHRLNRDGILLKGTDVLESVKQLDTVFFDKTGTLTEGKFKLVSREDRIDTENINRLVAGLEAFSEHPLSVPLSQLSPHPAAFKSVQNHIGLGLQGEFNNKAYRIGSVAFIQEWHPQFEGLDKHQVVLADQDGVLAQFRVEDQVRDGALATVRWLTNKGYEPIILSGDSQSRVNALAQELGFTNGYGDLKPADKLAHVTARQQAGHTVWMVGDGINDSPVLAQSDLSMTFSQASDLAQTSADVVLMSESLLQIKAVIQSALKTRVIMRQNFTWALVYNVSILPIAAFGLIAPWAAALGMSLSSLLVISNSLRLYRK